MDKLRAIATFVAIADAGSLTAAAARLGASLPSVVRTLAALERNVGVRLLNRTTRRLALTEEGRDYLERCRRILADVDEADAVLARKQRAPRGRIAVTASVLFGRLHVAPLVCEFLRDFPDVTVDLLLADRVVHVLEEGLDVAVRIGHLPDSSLVAMRVGDTTRVVCASPAYLKRAGTPRTPSDLRTHRCVRFTGLAPAPEWELAHRGRPVRVPIGGPLVTNQIDTAVDACVGGLGCGRFLSYQVRDALAAGTLVRVLGDFEAAPLPIQVVYPHAQLQSVRVRAFVEWLVPRLRARLAGGGPSTSGPSARSSRGARARRA